MTEKHVFVCDECGKESEPVQEDMLRRFPPSPEGWFGVYALPFGPARDGMVVPGSDLQFCSVQCVGKHYYFNYTAKPEMAS